ncbi:MAG: NAD(P)H-dependent oxidoreductase [Solobacterium sp.]|nr:NAD(P)H-dependent oxidoreductase [Solobacterium sp.]
MVLYINACVREQSRTKKLTEYLLQKIDSPVQERRLEDMHMPKADAAFLAERDSLIHDGKFGAELFAPAREFAQADTIVIAAPYWDLSFPAALKQYFEQINVIGLTFSYNEQGIPVGHCKAKKLYYVTTAGGQIADPAFGFGYVKALAETFYGIKDCVCFSAEGLDIYGADVDAILKDAEKRIDEVLQ